ncbi:hypothetical protein F3I27_23445 [Pantoea sp. Bo_2]|uniref:hypothetical protein n=1 Tax=unclassified Pantoea TaxID=2630326 RepID=UPI0012327BA7|nr:MULTISPECIES: hypothetical protein [unclassified Pantoea]KAA5920538.1 hypothetical protein F3I59_23810 [Pantoea sp. VH_8]KAA5935923.1 hypothetical protein F3I57_22980 [Pantoea sp. VH_3]KAA5944884.1 hypothetical protein F3I56_22995 [Pantoea sp. VH_25]KAA5949391.1 hypothetical protein F3I55_22650 [Pantoea sp. VH_24]KAA5955324.1 hypothetical protein F3I53_20390 [Pantoea sp. VH_16]
MRILNFFASVFLLSFLSSGVSYASVVSGQDVAAELNQRYENVVPDCDGNPAYYCSGIVIRVNEIGALPVYHPTWEPYTRVDDNFFQFSYIRNDIGGLPGVIYNFTPTGFGIILNARDKDVYSTRCMFPVNGTSLTRDNNGCGSLINVKDSNKDEDNSTCKSQGVFTADEWIKAYDGTDKSVCSFSSHDASAFYEAIKSTILLREAKGKIGNNELVLNSSPLFWDAKDPSKDHIQALWYNPKTNESSSLHGLAGAQSEQKLYFQLTKKWIPILSINIASEPAIFSYSESDQVITPQS